MTGIRPYRVGVIGTSWASRVPLPTFASYEGIELAAICSGRMERAEEAAERFGARIAVDDYRALVESADVDIVYIGAPVRLHREMALAASAAGKHVLCEKPLALDATEAREMLEAAREAAVAHVTSFFVRPFESHQYVKQLVASGAIGEPRQLSVTHFPGWERGAWSWLDSAEQGGGHLGAVGSHYIDLARDWLGEFASVSAQLRTWIGEAEDRGGVRRPVDADDAFLLAGAMERGRSSRSSSRATCRRDAGDASSSTGARGPWWSTVTRCAARRGSTSPGGAIARRARSRSRRPASRQPSAGAPSRSSER